MPLNSIFNALFLFQNFIDSGSITLEFGGNMATISREVVILDVQDMKKLTNFAEFFMQGKTSLEDKMQEFEEMACRFSEAGKTFVLKYCGTEVAIVGAQARPKLFDPKNVQIKNKFALLRLLSSF